MVQRHGNSWIRLIGSKLAIGLKVNGNGCLSVLALRQTGDLSIVYPASHPTAAGVGPSTLATLNWISGGEWMVLLFSV